VTYRRLNVGVKQSQLVINLSGQRSLDPELDFTERAGKEERGRERKVRGGKYEKEGKGERNGKWNGDSWSWNSYLLFPTEQIFVEVITTAVRR